MWTGVLIMTSFHRWKFKVSLKNRVRIKGNKSVQWNINGSVKWTFHPKVDGHDPNWTIIEQSKWPGQFKTTARFLILEFKLNCSIIVDRPLLLIWTVHFDAWIKFFRMAARIVNKSGWRVTDIVLGHSVLMSDWVAVLCQITVSV